MAKTINKDNAEHYIWGESCDGWHLLKSSGLSVIQERVPPGRGEVLHFHQHAHQFFFILSGIATFEYDGELFKIGPHQGCSVPPGVPHQLGNKENMNLDFIVISSPPSHGDRIEPAVEIPVKAVNPTI